MERVARFGFGRGCCEERQIVESRGQPAGRVAARLKFGQHSLGPRQHGRWEACQSSDRDAVAPIRWANSHFMEQHQITLVFAGADMVERERVELLGQPRQFMIMRGKKATAAIGFVHGLDNRPGNCKPVIGRCAAPDFIEDDEAVLGRLCQDRRRP